MIIRRYLIELGAAIALYCALLAASNGAFFHDIVEKHGRSPWRSRL